MTVREQVTRFVRATLNPLFCAGLMTRGVYKAVAQRCIEKVLASHPDETSAEFLMQECDIVRRFIMRTLEHVRAKGGVGAAAAPAAAAAQPPPPGSFGGALQ